MPGIFSSGTSADHRAVDGARGNGIHSDAMGGQIAGEDLGQRDDRTLAGGIMRAGGGAPVLSGKDAILMIRRIRRLHAPGDLAGGKGAAR
jgi:hypothetical protein